MMVACYGWDASITGPEIFSAKDIKCRQPIFVGPTLPSSLLGCCKLWQCLEIRLLLLLLVAVSANALPHRKVGLILHMGPNINC